MRLTVYRPHVSTYLSPDHHLIEKARFENIGDTRYVHGNLDVIPGEGDLVLISDSETWAEKLPASILSRIRLIIHPNSGYDTFSSSFVRSTKIPIVIGNHIRANAVADYTLSALFSHFSPIADQTLWNRRAYQNRKRLCDQFVLILGKGLIGTMVHDALLGAGTKVHVYDPFKGYTGWPEKKADILIICASLNPTSHHMVNRDFLISKMHADFLLINPARGKILHEDEFLSVMKERSAARACLDVFEEEPFDPARFRHHPNVIKTSHMAGAYKMIGENVVSFIGDILQDFLANPSGFESRHPDKILKNRLREEYLI
jgi:D-3-phosphoglycerate dehydrogenase